MIRFLSSVLLIAGVASAAADEVALPPGEIVGGFVEDDGTTVLLSTRYGLDAGQDDYSAILRIAKGATKVESFELPKVYGKSLQRLADGRLLLWGLWGPRDRDGYGVLAHQILQLRAGGEARQVWELKTPQAWLDYALTFSHDGKLWGVAAQVLARKRGEPVYGQFSGFDIALGSTKKRGAKVARTVSLRFDETDRFWSEDYWPGWSILDSKGPVVAVSWRDEDFIVHCAEECNHRVPVFGRPEERRERWQASDRILWSSTKGMWRAYRLWDFGLSGQSATEPFWEVDRKDGWKPHPERGVVRVVEGEHGYRIEHLWREPWTAIEEHHLSDWQPGSAPASALGNGWLVSANGRHATVIGTRQLEDEEGGGVAFSARSVDMRWEPRPLPPVEAAEPPADDDAAPGKKQDPPS